MNNTRTIDAHTALYGIIGKPVRHSLSPAMHNAAFGRQGMNAVYLAFETDDTAQACTAMRCLGIKGYSVTIPNKEGIVALLDERDESVDRIGACNTVRNDDGTLVGTNTDWIGAVRALERNGIEIEGADAVVLGAGGSARAVVYGLLRKGARVTVCNRTVEKAERLAAEFGCRAAPLSDAEEMEAHILVNTTSLGMGKSAHSSPLTERGVKNYHVVMDIVYSPLETTLLKRAKAAGRKTVNGLSMLLYQAVAQFEFWTGAKAPEEIMKRALEDG